MKMHKPPDSNISATSENLIDLYTRIPDYSEVQHLGQSDFINTLEKLKEEFRQCRASLYNEEFCSDSEYLAEKSSSGINIRSKTTDNLFYYTSNFNKNDNRLSCFDGSDNKATKINNHNLSTLFNDSGDVRATGRRPTDSDTAGGGQHGDGCGGGSPRQYLSIKSCELHRTPYRSTSSSSLLFPNRYLELGRSSMGGNLDSGKNDSAFHDDYSDDDDDEDYGNYDGDDGDRWSVGSSDSDVSLSKWSSNPEIFRSRSKEFLPPSNIEKRLLVRKSQNNSAPSVAFKDEDETEVPKQTFKANPVPDHVYKPLFEFIMLKNQRRSEKVKEQSKQRLLSQVKPFSFCKDSQKSASNSHHQGKVERSGEGLNNTKPPKKRRNDSLGNVKTNNNRLHSASTLFRAKPAPPRTKALLAAIRQKEQQEYRELKKRLRAEMLLKNASLPPSMAARERRTKLTNDKMDQVLRDYQKSFAEKKKSRNYRENSTGRDDTGLLTDEDRMTEDDSNNSARTSKKITTVIRPFKFSQRSPRKFTSFGTSRHSAAAAGVFESSSNDNLASKLRYQAAKLKEQARIKREEEEMLKIMRAERRRQKLRDAHLHAWQHACSYSAEQDIAMRRQLRHAASILERESFIKDMSCMLSRVRSAPLLLEGGHRLERRQEPCRKHREEYHKSSSSDPNRPWNKLSTPRIYSSNNWINRHGGSSTSRIDRYAEEKSETVALAEGSLSNSDNESGQDGGDGGRGNITTDTASDLEQEGGDSDDDGGGHGKSCKEKVSGQQPSRVKEVEKIGREARGSNGEVYNGDGNNAVSTDDDIDDEEENNDNDQDRQPK